MNSPMPAFQYCSRQSPADQKRRIPILQPNILKDGIYTRLAKRFEGHLSLCVPVSQPCVPVLQPYVPALQISVRVLQPCVPVLQQKSGLRSSIVTLRSSIAARVPRIPVLQPTKPLVTLFLGLCVPVLQPIYITL